MKLLKPVQTVLFGTPVPVTREANKAQGMKINNEVIQPVNQPKETSSKGGSRSEPEKDGIEREGVQQRPVTTAQQHTLQVLSKHIHETYTDISTK